MKKYLRCVQGGSSFTAGKRYEIVNENRHDYSVRNDGGVVELFSKKPDDHGLSYRDWFTLETEDDTPITALPDESLGGVLREYREVKRKAAVGERFKRINRGHLYKEGEVYIASYSDDCGVRDARFSHRLFHKNYVVIEPTDIIVINVRGDGGTERLRMVERKAMVGDRVIIVKEGSESAGGIYYSTGNVGCYVGDGVLYNNIRVKFDSPNITRAVSPGDYRVLEPVKDAPAPELSSRPATEQAAENVAALATRVQTLETQVAELGAQLRSVIEAANPAELSVSVAEVKSLVDAVSKKAPQQVRDEIVERAKADVKELLDRNYPLSEGYRPSIWFTNKDGSFITDKCEFVVNRNKRTVVALVRSVISGNLVARGIAKCAPNDVFNAHIGRAIALRRALGLEVPAEYLSAPNPEEPRVGDVVKYASGGVKTVASDAHTHINPSTETRLSLARLVGTIIDDSRMSEAEDNVAARKEVPAA